VPGSAAVVDALLGELPAESVVADPDVVDGYRFDRAKTVVPGTPVALVRAGSTAEVAATLRVASRLGVGVVTRGAGTGLSGGSAAVDGCITLSTERMRDVRIDAGAMVAVVRPGALNVEVKAAARA
jgi:glycolate oxidase